jgi:predicted  nucleic acid-binding Zn-ribbon protein
MVGGYLVAYQQDQASNKERFQDIKQTQSQNMADIKSSQEKIWQQLQTMNDKTDSRFAYVFQSCCKNASEPPPSTVIR